MTFARMHDVLSRHVSDGVLPGLVTLVSVGGEVHVDTIGTLADGGTEPMSRDTIFRIASMTKPVTAVAAMILVEECVLRLDDPVDRFLPELADRQVLTDLSAPLDSTVPANRPITVRDLLTFRMGFGMLFGDYPVAQAAMERDVAVGPPRPLRLTSDEWIAQLGSLPLMHQPGEQWMYHTGSDVLGVLIERASGQTLGDFLRERVFEPLGMADTSFVVPPEKHSRLAVSYDNDPSTGALRVNDDGGPDSMWSSGKVFQQGGGGLVSTADDFHAFGQMLLRGGSLDGVRLLSPASVSLMTLDHLTPAQKAISGFFPGYFDTRGWGFGMCVTTGRDGLPPAGRFGWDGGLGTSWWSDPASDVVGILLTQRQAFPLDSAVYLDFWTALYQEIP